MEKKSKKEKTEQLLKIPPELTVVDNMNGMAMCFSGIRNYLLYQLGNAKYVVGCMAWFTDWNILDFMIANIEGVSLVVQTETYLMRNDRRDKWREKIKTRYGQLKVFPWERWEAQYPHIFENGTLVRPSTVLKGEHTPLAVRVEGQKYVKRKCFSSSKAKVQPQAEAPEQQEELVEKKTMMHMKFLIFFNEQMIPNGLWTGSYNLTMNAAEHSEEVVYYFRDERVIRAHFDKFLKIFATSRPYRSL